ncbi:hypothetical protein LZY01_16150 [Levilactobacillus zymae]|uniref:Uncharacterized protein n=1 Tax=Levilactobacillus zymae TaxID=267363 RepID=A0ABQ0X261_9LACO|nr:hypothetical protein LZY01_16150 [Levilactobacillus zymae]
MNDSWISVHKVDISGTNGIPLKYKFDDGPSDPLNGTGGKRIFSVA